MLSEISKREKDRQYMNSLICEIKKKKRKKEKKNLIGKENRMVVAWESEQDRE